MDIANILLHLKIDGWHVEPRIIPVDEVDSVRKSVEKSSIPKGNPNQGVNSETSLISKDQSLTPYLCHDGVLKVVESFIGQHFKISFTTAIVNNPGNDRGVWHSDWPFNQNNAGHIQAPYHDAVTHLTTIWMLSPFSVETGGTLIVPGSHRSNNNPSGDMGIDPLKSYPTEMHATGDAGSVLFFDSRLWHATATNLGDKPRVGVAVRFAPWWLNLDSLMPGSDTRKRMVEEPGPGIIEPEQGLIPNDVFNNLPEKVKPMFRHWRTKH